MNFRSGWHIFRGYVGFRRGNHVCSSHQKTHVYPSDKCQPTVKAATSRIICPGSMLWLSVQEASNLKVLDMGMFSELGSFPQQKTVDIYRNASFQGFKKVQEYRSWIFRAVFPLKSPTPPRTSQDSMASWALPNRSKVPLQASFIACTSCTFIT